MWRAKALFALILVVPAAVGWFTFADGSTQSLPDRELAALVGGATQKYCWPCANCDGTGSLCSGAVDCEFPNQTCNHVNHQEYYYFPQSCVQEWGNEYCTPSGNLPSCKCYEHWSDLCKCYGPDGGPFNCDVLTDPSTTERARPQSADACTGCIPVSDAYDLIPCNP